MRSTDNRLPYWKFREIGEIIKIFRKSLAKDEESQKKRFHRKGYGLIYAKFQINEDLPIELQSEFFEAGRVYDNCQIRYSHGAEEMKSDLKKGVFGVSLKVDVDKYNIDVIEQNGAEKKQDFLMATNPIQFPGTLTSFERQMKGVFGNRLQFIFYSIINIFLDLKAFRIFASSRRKESNILGCHFFSGAAYLFRNKQQKERYVKWYCRIKPEDLPKLKHQSKSKHRIFENIKATVEQEQISIEFGAQFQQVGKNEPVNNTQKLWRGKFQPLAEIIISIQKNFGTEENNKLADAIDYNPWHSSHAHKPVGDLNEARRIVYKEMAKFRAKMRS